MEDICLSMLWDCCFDIRGTQSDRQRTIFYCDTISNFDLHILQEIPVKPTPFNTQHPVHYPEDNACHIESQRGVLHEAFGVLWLVLKRLDFRPWSAIKAPHFFASDRWYKIHVGSYENGLSFFRFFSPWLPKIDFSGRHSTVPGATHPSTT